MRLVFYFILNRNNYSTLYAGSRLILPGVKRVLKSVWFDLMNHADTLQSGTEASPLQSVLFLSSLMRWTGLCRALLWSSHFLCGTQLKEEGDATDESHKQAVRKRRVRKDWRGGPHDSCLLSPPMGRRWKGRLCSFPLSMQKSMYFLQPTGSLQSPQLAHLHLHLSATLITGPQASQWLPVTYSFPLSLSPPSCLFIQLSDKFPGDFVHLEFSLPPSQASKLSSVLLCLLQLSKCFSS